MISLCSSCHINIRVQNRLKYSWPNVYCTCVYRTAVIPVCRGKILHTIHTLFIYSLPKNLGTLFRKFELFIPDLEDNVSFVNQPVISCFVWMLVTVCDFVMFVFLFPSIDPNDGDLILLGNEIRLLDYNKPSHFGNLSAMFMQWFVCVVSVCCCCGGGFIEDL